MALKKYNNLLTYESWFIKYPKDAHIIYLIGLSQKLMDESKNKSDKSNIESTKGLPSYIRDIPYCIWKDPKRVMGNKTNYGREFCCKEHRADKCQWVFNKP